MANKTVRYERLRSAQNEPLTAAAEHEFVNEKLIINPHGKAIGKEKIVDSLKPRFVMKDGDTFEVPKEEFDMLVKAGKVMTKKELKERKELVKSKTPIYKMKAADQALMLNDKPFEE